MESKFYTNKTCLWRMVADMDLAKRSAGSTTVTLGWDRPCYDCEGVDRTCQYYKQNKTKTNNGE